MSIFRAKWPHNDFFGEQKERSVTYWNALEVLAFA